MSRTGSAAITVYDVIDGSVPTYERYYSTTPGLLSEMGYPGDGVTTHWTQLTGTPVPAAPVTAFWVAERFTIDSVASAWQVYPVQAKDGGIPFVTGTESGSNKPTLGDSVWIADALAAVIAFTGRPYTNQKEFGYGTTVVITYDDGKLTGTFKRSGSSDTWVAPASFIDGNLIVDGSIAADHLAANTITADEIATGAITADEIAAGTITADEIAVGTIGASRITVAGAGAATYRVADYSRITEAMVEIIVGTHSASDGGLYAWLLETVVVGRYRADADDSGGALNIFDVTAVADYGAGTAQSSAESTWVSTYIDTPIRSVSFTDGTQLLSEAVTANTIGAVSPVDIYTLGTTDIDGGKITTGSIKASKITIDDNISFSNTSSGIIFNKTSLTSGDHGAFYGKGLAADGVTPVAGFAISSPTSSILMDSAGTFRLIGVDIYTGAPGAVTEYDTAGSHVYSLGVTTTALDITIIAGGGSGSSNAAGDRSASWKVNGNVGSPTSVSFHASTDGTGASLGGYTTTGGAGAVWSVQSNVNYGYGASGDASSKAPGGAGGTPSTPSSNTGAGSYGSGGGSGGAYGFNGSPIAITNNGGGAGTTVSITSIPSGALSVKFTIGSGGAAPTVPSDALTAKVTAGGAGGVGYASVSNPAGGGTQIDLDVLGDAWYKAVPVWNTVASTSFAASASAATASFGTVAGWYAVKGGTETTNQYTSYSYFQDTSGGGTASLGSVSFLYFSAQPTASGVNYSTNNSGTRYARASFKWFKL